MVFQAINISADFLSDAFFSFPCQPSIRLTSSLVLFTSIVELRFGLVTSNPNTAQARLLLSGENNQYV